MTAIVFDTPGLIDVRAFTTMGLSAKPNSTNPIGYFGTGLKYAIATMVRLGAEPVVFIGRDKYIFKKKPGTFRGTAYDGLMMRREKWSLSRATHYDLPFTTEYGRNWLPWMAFRELESNTRDEGGTTWVDPAHPSRWIGVENNTRIIIDHPEFIKAWEKQDEIFLKDGWQNAGTGVQVLDGPGRHLYYRGMKVFDLPKPSLYTYNFIEQVFLTEDRTLNGDWYVKGLLARYVAAEVKDEAFIQRIVTAAQGTWEENLEFPTYIKPSAAFVKVMARRPRGLSVSSLGYFAPYDTRPSPTILSPLQVHPLPWVLQGDRVLDGKGQGVFVAPESYPRRWTVGAFILERLFPADSPRQALPQEVGFPADGEEGADTEGSHEPQNAEGEAVAVSPSQSTPDDDIPF